MTDMLQTYLNSYKKRFPVQNNQNTYSPKTVVSQESLRTHVKAYKPIGHIIDENPYSLIEAAKSDMRSLKYFAKGINGKGDDYSVGKINDVAIKLGSLGIAGIIAVTKSSPLQKSMEFVGLACWFAAMSLWPKLAINAPVKLLKGVDLDSEYVTWRGKRDLDSKFMDKKGHRKPFYQDPQFICWDMISDEKINEMGDKLGVPQNIKNRRQAIEKKAKQVAIQGNTLALLTAGFATPLIASLSADQLSKKVVAPIINNIQTKQAHKLKNIMENEARTLSSNAQLEDLINNSFSQEITNETKKSLTDAIVNSVSDKTIKKDVRDLANNILESNVAEEGKIILNDDISKQIVSLINKVEENTNTASLVETVKNKYPEGLKNSVDVENFLAGLKHKLLDADVIHSTKKMQSLLDDIRTQLSAVQTSGRTNESELKRQLINLTKLATTYDEKIYKNFEKNYFNKYWTGDTSCTANFWAQMSEDLIKALNPDKQTLQDIIEAPSGKLTTNLIADLLTKTVNSERYDEALDILIKSADKLAFKQVDDFRFSLKYLDDMQKLLTTFKNERMFLNFSQHMENVLAYHRCEIFSKYFSSINTLYNPIRALSILKEAQQNNPAEYPVLVKLFAENQNVDTFINKFYHLKDTMQAEIADNPRLTKVVKGAISNDADYYKYINLLFGNLPANVRGKMSNELANDIDKSTAFIKSLLMAQFDGVNCRLNTDTTHIYNAFKAFGIEKYFDEFCGFTFKNMENIKNRIAGVLKSDWSKYNELRKLFVITEDEIRLMQSSDFELYRIIHHHLNGAPSFPEGFLKQGRSRLKSLTQFLGIQNIDDLGELSFGIARPMQTAKSMPKQLNQHLKDAAKEHFIYNRWFKRVGIAFLALCGVTAISIACMGRKNAYNPDKYVERKSA